MRISYFLSKGFLILLLIAFVYGLPSLDAAVEESQVPIEVSGDQIEYMKQENKIVATGNVLVTYQGVKLSCDKAQVYTDKKIADAEGHVYIYQEPGQVLRGEKITYDFKNHRGSFPNGRITANQWFGRGEKIEQISRDEIRVFNASVTTCPYDRPHYDVKAKKIVFYPGDKIIAHDVRFQVLGRTILWWPYFIIPLDTEDAPFQIEPGYSSRYGFYLLGSKATSLNKNVKMKFHLDYRSKKGIAGGVDTRYAFEKMGDGTIQVYGGRDEEAPNRRVLAGLNPYKNKKAQNRGRFSFKHRVNLDSYSNIITEWNYFSDEFFLRDFFEREFRREPQPKSFITFTKNSPKYGFLIDINKRTNRFFNALEKLPEVRFTWNRREIMNTNVYYRADHQFVNYNNKHANSSEDQDVVRLDSFHEFSYPMKVLKLDVVPFMNGRESWFSKNRFGEEGVERHAFGGGVDVSTRFYKTYEAQTNFLGLDIHQLRHVLEPSVRYDSIRFASVDPRHLQIFDSTDEVYTHKDEFSFGFENRIQTKRFRNGSWQRVDLVSFNTFLIYSYDDFILENSQWKSWRQEVQVRPYDWLTAQFISEFDMPSGQFRFADTDLIFEKDKFRFLLNHRFEKSDNGFSGKSLLTYDINYRLNPLWSLGGFMRIEFDTANVEEWEIRATRDLHDWYLDFGYNVRNSEIDSSNKEVFFELRLKAFPQFPLKGGHRASFARPRFGHFVSGSNPVAAPADNISTTPQYS